MVAPSILSAIPLLFTVGVLLVALEFNRPGRVLPGCVGLFATIWVLATLARLHQPAAMAFLIAGLGLSAVDLVRSHRLASIFAGFAYFAGFLLSARRTHASTAIAAAILCSLLLGLTLAKLSHLAERARTSKRRL